MFFDEKKSICFTNDPYSVIGNHCSIVCQLMRLSVLKIKYGPKCIHTAIVSVIFNVEQPLEFETVEGEMLN